MSFDLPQFSRVQLDRISHPFAAIGSHRLSPVPTAPPPPPSEPPALPPVLDLIQRLDSCDVVGPLAAACLLACGAVLCMMFSRPIAKTAEFSLLVGAQLIGALIQADYLYAWMAGPYDASSDGSGVRFGQSTAFEEWLRHFSSFGTSLYFLTLSTQLLRTTLSPFDIGSTLGYHVATCSVATALAVVAAHFELDVDTGGARWGSAFLPDAETGRWILVGFRTAIYALALAMLVYAWRLILYGVQGDAAFTQRRRILTLALASILLSEAIFGLFPPLIPPILRYGLNLSDDVASCSTTILLGLQDVALAATWLVVFSCSERALRTARVRDTASLEDGFVPEGVGDLSAALRAQLVSLITVGACRSARDMREESGAGPRAGAISPAACAADGEYRRVVPLARFEPPCARGRQMPVRVLSFAPRVFHELRRSAGVSTDDYVQSLSGEKTERFTEGRSGTRPVSRAKGPHSGRCCILAHRLAASGAHVDGWVWSGEGTLPDGGVASSPPPPRSPLTDGSRRCLTPLTCLCTMCLPTQHTHARHIVQGRFSISRTIVATSSRRRRRKSLQHSCASCPDTTLTSTRTQIRSSTASWERTSSLYTASA